MNATEIKDKTIVSPRARRRSRKSEARQATTPVAPVASREPTTGVRIKSKPKAQTLTAEERRRWIEGRAYALAEARGFHGGSALEDWLRAEAEVDGELHGKLD
jgi:Protein of unknown function (DUF2934)